MTHLRIEEEKIDGSNVAPNEMVNSSPSFCGNRDAKAETSELADICTSDDRLDDQIKPNTKEAK